MLTSRLKNQELKTPRFSLYTCSHDEFTAFCLKNKVRNDRVEYVWDLIRGSGNNNELADKYFVEPQTIKQDRWRYKKKFANVLDKTTTGRFSHFLLTFAPLCANMYVRSQKGADRSANGKHVRLWAISSKVERSTVNRHMLVRFQHCPPTYSSKRFDHRRDGQKVSPSGGWGG